MLIITLSYNRCSIGSASSLQEDGREDNGNCPKVGDESGSDHIHRLGLGDLGVRRVSDISHINEIRREVNRQLWYCMDILTLPNLKHTNDCLLYNCTLSILIQSRWMEWNTWTANSTKYQEFQTQMLSV